MARLPEVTDLRRRMPQARRGVSSVRNAGAVGAAVAGFGDALGAAGDARFAAGKREREKEADFRLAEAKSRYLREAVAAEQGIREGKSWAEWEKSYGDKATELRGAISAGLNDPDRKREFEIWAKDAETRAKAGIYTAAREKRADDGRARLLENVNANLDTAVAAPSAADREAFLAATADMYDGAVADGWITAEDAARLKRTAAQNYATRRLAMMEPEDRLKELEGGTLAGFLPPDALAVEKRKATEALRVKGEQGAQDRGRQRGATVAAMADYYGSSDPYKQAAARIAGIESSGDANAKNPRSSATGPGQFINSTWLGLMRETRPDLTAGRSEADILAMRKDPKIALEMTEAYARRNGLVLERAGIEATPANLYLAHFLDGPVAAKVLAADEATPLGEVIGAEAMAANPHLAGWDVADVKAWAARKAGGDYDPVAYLRNIDDPDERSAAMNEYSRHQALKASAAEAERDALADRAFALVAEGQSVLDLPREAQLQLGREAMSALLEYEKKVASGQKVTTDQVFYASLMDAWATDPELFKSLDPITWRAKLSDADYKGMVDRQAGLKQGEKPDMKPREAAAIMSQAAVLLSEAGVETGPGAGKDDKQRTADFQREMLDAEEAFIRENGRRMSPKEFNDRARVLLTEVAVLRLGGTAGTRTRLGSLEEVGIDREAFMEDRVTIDGIEFPEAARGIFLADLTARLGRAPSIEEQAADFKDHADKLRRSLGREPTPDEVVEFAGYLRARKGGG